MKPVLEELLNLEGLNESGIWCV